MQDSKLTTSSLLQAPPDPLLSIDGRFKADQRAGKLNLGIGVLRRTDASAHEFATVLEAAKSVPVSTYYPHPGKFHFPDFLLCLADVLSKTSRRR